jgi:hypothetical protein
MFHCGRCKGVTFLRGFMVFASVKGKIPSRTYYTRDAAFVSHFMYYSPLFGFLEVFCTPILARSCPKLFSSAIDYHSWYTVHTWSALSGVENGISVVNHYVLLSDNHHTSGIAESGKKCEAFILFIFLQAVLIGAIFSAALLKIYKTRSKQETGPVVCLNRFL